MGDSQGNFDKTPLNTNGIMGSITPDNTGDESCMKQRKYTKLNKTELYVHCKSSFLLTTKFAIFFHLVCTNT